MSLKNVSTLYFVISLFCYAINANATHIVGGVMNYQYLGNDRYEISLYVYRDCINGVPPLDDPAIIRIWDGVAESYSFRNIPFDSILDPGVPDACAQIETPVCVNWTRYRDTLILPPNDFGYTIYYQRCCRNNTIQNLTYNSRGNAAMDWGATYTINIPTSDNNGQNINNTSPYFLNYPPVYICVNKPITYNNSAIDSDGDSLVYSLCTPYSGAFPDDPLNYYIEEVPPFEHVVWDSSYSVNDMLGGVPLSINSSTGILTGTPNTIGQFVVGVCVDEYRNGQWLTQTSRDFQFNIIDCNLQVVSSFFAPTIQCNDFTVNFQNQSSGATDYIWYFGDGDSSTAINPSHTYSDTGKYIVTLISKNNITNTCTATYTQEISVQYKKIDADFIVTMNSCLGINDPIQFIDKSTDTLHVVAWKWHFSNGDSSNSQHPILLYNGIDTSLTITLTATSVNGCSSTITKSISLFPKPAYNLNRILTKCTNTGDAQISLIAPNNSIISWSPTIGLNNPFIANPTTNINTNITYYVSIKTPLENGDTCVQYDSIQVKTINSVQINTRDTLRVCKDSVRLQVPISDGQSVIWSTNANFQPIIGTTASISVVQTNLSQQYFVKIIAQECEAIDSILVFFSDTIPIISLADKLLQCSNNVHLNAAVDNSHQIVWSNSPSFTNILSTTNTYSTVQTSKTVNYYVQASYNTCKSIDSIQVTVQDTLPLISLEDSVIICGENMAIINATVRRFTAVEWSDKPDFSSIIWNSPTLYISLSETRKTYYIKAYYRDCFTIDSIIVNHNDKQLLLQLDDSIQSCSNSINIHVQVQNADNIIWSTYPTFLPIISTQNILHTIQNTDTQKYYIKISNGLCNMVDSIVSIVQSGAPIVQMDDEMQVCADSVRIKSNAQNYDTLFWSTDINFTNIISHSADITISQQAPEVTYYIKLIKQQCIYIDSIHVLYSDSIPNISLSSSSPFCSDSVFAYAFADFYTEVEWFDDRNLTHLISTTLTLQMTQTIGEKWYYCKVKYKSCVALDSIKITNNAIHYSKPNYEICADSSLTVQLNVQTPTQYDVLWFINGDTLETNNIATLNISLSQSQIIKFRIDNILGCTIQDSIYVIVHQLPLVEASVDKTSIYIGEEVQLTATNHQQYAYHWQPAESLSNANIYNPVATPIQTTTFIVEVKNENQCRNIDSVNVQVIANECHSSNLFIPNAFSPNGDGVNDILKVKVHSLKSMHLEIYDRWGHKVFESNDINEAWNGTYKSKPAPADTYGYYFIGECIQGEKISKKGNITLLY